MKLIPNGGIFSIQKLRWWSGVEGSSVKENSFVLIKMDPCQDITGAV